MSRALLLVIALLVAPVLAEDRAPVHREVFSEVWTLARDHFMDSKMRGLDWEAVRARYSERAARATTIDELSGVINEMLGELNTSHTRHFTNLEPAYYQLLAVFQDVLREELAPFFPDGVLYTSAGLLTEEIDGATFVRGVLDGSPASAKNIRVGDRILSADGAPFHPVLSLRDREEGVLLEIQPHENGEGVFFTRVHPETVDPRDEFQLALTDSARIFERGGRRILYVHVWSYAGERYHGSLLMTLDKTEFSDVDGLVMDLREGWGGASVDYLRMFQCGIPRTTSIFRKGEARDAITCWDKPVTLLVNEATRSGKEIFVYGFKKMGIGRVVGARTAGAVTGGRAFVLSDGSLLYLAVADVLTDGERLEGVGVAPDVEVPFEIPYARGQDPQLERAITLLLQEIEDRR
jgi:carboxyl-terminal processing protease